MSCQECELLLAEGDVSSVQGHLAACADCRTLLEDMQANAAALGAMRADTMSVLRKRPRPGWIWAAAGIAAAVVVAVSLWQPAIAPVPPPVAPVVAATVAPPAIVEPVALVRSRPTRPKAPVVIARAEPLLVKLLTPDPDVVIYWLIDPEEGTLQ